MTHPQTNRLRLAELIMEEWHRSATVYRVTLVNPQPIKFWAGQQSSRPQWVVNVPDAGWNCSILPPGMSRWITCSPENLAIRNWPKSWATFLFCTLLVFFLWFSGKSFVPIQSPSLSICFGGQHANSGNTGMECMDCNKFSVRHPHLKPGVDATCYLYTWLN